MQKPSRHNSHHEIRKTITLIAGILLVFTGVLMLYHGITTSGAVDFKTTFINGKMETGSAGFLAVIVGAIIIYLANKNPDKSTSNNSPGGVATVLFNSKQLVSILSFVVILTLILLIYFLEPIRIYLIGLIGFIIYWNFRTDSQNP